jgi:hypothetical protein
LRFRTAAHKEFVRDESYPHGNRRLAPRRPSRWTPLNRGGYVARTYPPKVTTLAARCPATKASGQQLGIRNLGAGHTAAFSGPCCALNRFGGSILTCNHKAGCDRQSPAPCWDTPDRQLLAFSGRGGPHRGKSCRILTASGAPVAKNASNGCRRTSTPNPPPVSKTRRGASINP